MSDRPDSAPPPRKPRTGLVVGLVAGGVAVVLGLAVGLVVVVTSGGGQPADTVRTYLQALADGNAPLALAQGATPPPDTTFATSAVAQAQQQLARITSIDVQAGSTTGDHARVPATYRFGAAPANESFSLTRTGGAWKLDDTVYPVDLTRLAEIPGLTLMGVAAAGRSRAYVFPGPLAWGSSNPYLSVTGSQPNEFTLSPADATHASATLKTDLSAAGRKAVAATMSAVVARCAAAKTLMPGGCPQREYDYRAVDGTATWKAPTDLSALSYRTGSPVTTVYVTGTLRWSVTYTAEDAGGTRTPVRVDAVNVDLYGTVDLTKSPLAYAA